MILQQIQEAHFFAEWEQRFEDESSNLITTGDRKVLQWSREAMPNANVSDKQVARSAWSYVYNNTEYKLSEKWKTPRETIESGRGDCEDVTFLLSSMFPNMGIESHMLSLGRIVFPDGTEEYHTWNVVDGMVVDATGTYSASQKVNYDTVEDWVIEVD